ncbi:transmembrane protein [Perilla frutescens var. hirtella]|uniref:Transmembrane protein n=1 Tax=Perilla frutescens var. hirtella TaxID=608512 RepID=A0AAD4PAN6_PERFH|nr:transmembrane protein [Perilla frutescens var. frutescens]KAH6832973.1 transmembrane protein [Perilla frutescens var. hirtella]
MSSLIQSTTQTTLSGIGNLIKLLPTGTVFLFQFLNPLLTNNGQCDPINKYLSSILIAACGISCCFASFTDSYVGSDDGVTHYGIVTSSGLWPASSSQDLSSYGLRVGDFVHAFCAVLVFAIVVLLDPNSVQCYYPSFDSTQKALMMALPPVVGVVTGAIFAVFPNNRHGIGYPLDLILTPSSASA